MDRPRLNLLCELTALVGVAALFIAAGLFIGPEKGFQDAIAAAEMTNAPDLLIEDVASLQYPDPVHLRLPDGRLFRLAQVIGPDPGTPEYSQALELVSQPLAYRGNLKRGLRFRGTDAAGERLAEPWGLQSDLPRCGNVSPAERRSLGIPHWNNLTRWLVSPGLFWLDAGVTDPSLLGAQSAARKGGLGIWANPVYLRRLVDLAACEALLDPPTPPWGPELRDRRLESADLLLRTDPAVYVPRLLRVVQDPREVDIFMRIGTAQRLDKAGYKEGTGYLMEAVRLGRKAPGVTELEINSIKYEYQTFSWQRALK